MKLERIREWREARGLTQHELAAAADVGHATVARTELGASTTPKTARKIATALGLEVTDLMAEPPAYAGKAEAPSTGRSQAEGSFEPGVRLATLEYTNENLPDVLKEAKTMGDELGVKATLQVEILSDEGGLVHVLSPSEADRGFDSPSRSYRLPKPGEGLLSEATDAPEPENARGEPRVRR